MTREVIQCAILFADVVGSTAVYEKYGNTKAKNSIEKCLDRMIEITNSKNGKVIKTIGDEVMCRFLTADAAVGAAVGIQEAMKGIVNIGDEVALKVRIGVHVGDAILENNDVFGDAVNIAARMADIAKADQIITTKGTYNQLTGFLKGLCREYDKTSIKGKADLITIYDVLWDDDDGEVTIIASATSSFLNDNRITLVVMGHSSIFHVLDMPVTIGRGAKTSVPVNAPFVSRIHAIIAYNRGKFVLKDQSTNGTYVQLSDGKEVFLRREELPLSFTGSIALGEKVDGCDTVIRFLID